MSRCGYVRLNTTENNRLLGEPLPRFPLRKDEEAQGLLVQPQIPSLCMKGDSNDGKQTAVLCPADQCFFRRVSTRRPFLSASRANTRFVVRPAVCARDLCQQRSSLGLSGGVLQLEFSIKFIPFIDLRRRTKTVTFPAATRPHLGRNR